MPEKQVKIMLIEDDPLCLAGLSQALRLNGFTTGDFGSPLDALQAYDADQYAAIITDYHLPSINGIEVLAQVKKRNPQAFVIVISGDRDAHIREQAIKQGARNCFLKPLDIYKIIEQLEKVIPHHKSI